MGWLEDYSADEINELFKEDGRREGFAKGLADGGTYKLISQICRKIEKGETVTEIARDLDEDESVIEPIYKVAKNSAPDYDVRSIFEQTVMAETNA